MDGSNQCHRGSTRTRVMPRGTVQTHRATWLIRLSTEENDHNFLQRSGCSMPPTQKTMRCWNNCAPIPSSNSSITARHNSTELRSLRPPPDEELVAEPCRWAYYPWRRTVVAVLGPRGVSSGAVGPQQEHDHRRGARPARRTAHRCRRVERRACHRAHPGRAGMCGELRLADFDRLELSNLNRVPATVLDLGLNKAEVAARRIAELDPYLRLRVLDAGLTLGHRRRVPRRTGHRCRGMRFVGHEGQRSGGCPCPSDTGVDGHRPTEACSTWNVSISSRSARSCTVYWATWISPSSPRMSSREKVPHMLRFLEAEKFSPRALASVLEIDRTLSTWPQVVR